jgi:hypothetical protein
MRVEMLFLTAAVYANYSSYIVDTEGIEPEDDFVAGPRSTKLRGLRRLSSAVS